MNWIDILLLAIVLLAVLGGLYRGFLLGSLELAGWIAIPVVAPDTSELVGGNLRGCVRGCLGFTLFVIGWSGGVEPADVSFGVDQRNDRAEEAEIEAGVKQVIFVFEEFEFCSRGDSLPFDFRELYERCHVEQRLQHEKQQQRQEALWIHK